MKLPQAVLDRVKEKALGIEHGEIIISIDINKQFVDVSATNRDRVSLVGNLPEKMEHGTRNG